MAVTVVLAEGFSGEDVEVVVAGRTYQVGSARTSLLTGMAAEVVDGAVGDEMAEGDQIEVTARLARSVPQGPAAPDHPVAPGDQSAAGDEVTGGQTSGTTYIVSPEEVLVLDLVGGRLTGRVVPGPVGFA